MDDKTKKEYEFYYDGIFYETKEDFIRAVQAFTNSPACFDSSERILRKMCNDIKSNLLLASNKSMITNEHLMDICAEVIPYIINKIRRKEEEWKDRMF